jgi:hypothetical protein
MPCFSTIWKNAPNDGDENIVLVVHMVRLVATMMETLRWSTFYLLGIMASHVIVI